MDVGYNGISLGYAKEDLSYEEAYANLEEEYRILGQNYGVTIDFMNQVFQRFQHFDEDEKIKSNYKTLVSSHKANQPYFHNDYNVYYFFMKKDPVFILDAPEKPVEKYGYESLNTHEKKINYYKGHLNFLSKKIQTLRSDLEDVCSSHTKCNMEMLNDLYDNAYLLYTSSATSNSEYNFEDAVINTVFLAVSLTISSAVLSGSAYCIFNYISHIDDLNAVRENPPGGLMDIVEYFLA